MPCFVSSESNLKKPDPETSSGRQYGWHPQTCLGVLIAVNIIITMGSRINKSVFELFKFITFFLSSNFKCKQLLNVYF